MIYSAYIAGEVLKDTLQRFPQEKVQGQETISNRKATKIYEALDKYPSIFKVVPDKSVRSRMNICFIVTHKSEDVDWQKKFIVEAESKGLFGLKGHRSVGGVRASNCKFVFDVVNDWRRDTDDLQITRSQRKEQTNS